jgi:hypothetical protein
MSNPTPPPPRKRGCLFYGCLTGVVLLALACVLAFFAFRFVNNQINAFADSTPAPLPKVEMSDDEFQGLQERLQVFGRALKEGKPAEALALTERDLNALILKSPNAKGFSDKVYVSLDGSNVTGQVSIPLSDFGRFGKGRYLNGEAAFNVSLENGVLSVTARDIRVKGRPLPESFMEVLRKENLAGEACKEPKAAEAIRQFESIQVREGRVIIKARSTDSTR